MAGWGPTMICQKKIPLAEADTRYSPTQKRDKHKLPAATQRLEARAGSAAGFVNSRMRPSNEARANISTPFTQRRVVAQPPPPTTDTTGAVLSDRIQCSCCHAAPSHAL